MREAIERTLRAIEARSRLYRNATVTVIAVATLSASVALFWRWWAGLAGMVALAPATGILLILDSRRVRRWRKELAEMGRSGGLDRDLFERTIGSFRHVPRRTLRGMLDTLPGDLAGAKAADRAGRREERRILAGTAALTAGLGFGVAGAATGSTILFACAGASLLSLVILRRSSRP